MRAALIIPRSGFVELAMKLESLKETKREDRQGQVYPCSTQGGFGGEPICRKTAEKR
jgi:hypothetical protein